MFRFALLPTGDIDIHNLLIAIVNYVLAQQNNEKFLICIDDLEVQETMQGKDTESMMLLEKFALKHDAVFHQSEHLKLYQTLALRLLENKNAFISTATNPNEKLDTQSYSTLKASGEKVMLSILPDESIETTEAFSILNEEGIPSKAFAIAADDMMHNIDFVIQGAEKHSMTVKEVYLKKLLGYENETRYLYLPSIQDQQEVSVKALLQEGYLPDALINYAILVGYQDAPKKIFTLPDAITWFDLEALTQSAIAFDEELLQEINVAHLKQLDDKTLSKLFGFADADIGKLAKLYLEEHKTITALQIAIRRVFTPKNFDAKLGTEMQDVANLIAQAPTFQTFEELKAYLKTKSSINEEALYQTLQYLFLGSETGPELSQVYPCIKSYLLEVIS